MTILGIGTDVVENVRIKNAIRNNKFVKRVFSEKEISLSKKYKNKSGGTDKMLKKCRSKNFINSGVLVKFPKKKQDIRIDLPTVGLKTLKQCKSAGLKGIVVKSKQNVFLEKKQSINFANKNKMFILSK